MTTAAREPFKRGQRGLYAGKRVRFGNNVSHSQRKCVHILFPRDLQTPHHRHPILQNKKVVEAKCAIYFIVERYPGGARASSCHHLCAALGRQGGRP